MLHLLLNALMPSFILPVQLSRYQFKFNEYQK